MAVYDIEELYSYLGVFGNFQMFVVVMYTIGERVTAGLLDFQVSYHQPLGIQFKLECDSKTF